MTAQNAVAVDHCSRCPDAPLMAPNRRPAMGDAHIVVLNYRCEAGHRWQRIWRRPELKRTQAKVDRDRSREVGYLTGQRPRPHLDADKNPRIPYDSAALADAASIRRSEQTGLPSPRIYRCPTCHLWHTAS